MDGRNCSTLLDKDIAIPVAIAVGEKDCLIFLDLSHQMLKDLAGLDVYE